MKNKRLVRLFCLFIPTRKGRAAFRARHYMGSVFGAAPHLFREVQLKRESLLQQAERIETLFLGSSHVAYGVNPEHYSESSFNLASVSQDLFTSYELLKKVLPQLPNLKRVFLGYSVFSQGFYVALTRERNVCSTYKYVYGIDYDPPRYCDHFELECRKLNACGHQLAGGERNSNGFLFPPPITMAGEVEARVKSHLRENHRDVSQHGWIEKMHTLLRAGRAEGAAPQLHLLVPPARKDYRSQMPPGAELFAQLQQLAQEHNLPIHNFYEEEYADADFYDFDHLNVEGAMKWTKQIKALNYD